mgnify:CR=1 FL=1
MRVLQFTSSISEWSECSHLVDILTSVISFMFIVLSGFLSYRNDL